jgi:hypothetical protein
VIKARSRGGAQDVVDRLVAADAVFQCSAPIEEWSAFPAKRTDLEDLLPSDYEFLRARRYSTGGLAHAAAIAAKCSRRRAWTYSLVRLWLSLRLTGGHWRTFHPDEGPAPGIVKSPTQHVVYSQAIVSAYLALEQLGLVFPSGKEAYVNGAWVPAVRADLERRLDEANVKSGDPFTWTVRGTPTRIERLRPIPSGSRPSWSAGGIRDRRIPLAEALLLSRWLRSKVSAHASEVLQSVTLADAHNVQTLARRVLLESIGYLPGKERW